MGVLPCNRPGRVDRLELVVDVPSRATGTGERLFLDGQDVAFLRAQLVDQHGVIVRASDANVTYAVVSGPARVVGVGSGNCSNQQATQGRTYSTWQGLGRVILQATVDCTGPHRSLARRIDLDAAATAYAATCPPGDIVVEATCSVKGSGSEGGSGALGRTRRLSATVRLPTSGRLEDSPLQVARATKRLDTFTYFDAVQP